jgi:hypothetical protein
LCGLASARERGWLLAWDAAGGLHLFNRSGERQAWAQAPAPLAAAGCADDGSALAAVGTGGQVWLLAPDLTPRWERLAPAGCTAAAIDPYGQYVAAADSGGGLTVFDRGGRPRWRVRGARPLKHVTFVPEKPALAASADFGLTAAFDFAGRLLWRDAPLAHVGSLAVSGDGAVIALACFSEGVTCYSVGRPSRRPWPGGDPCRLAALSYDGDAVLTAGLDGRLRLRDAAGAIRAEAELEGAAVGLALGPLAGYAAVALAEGKVLCLATS